MFKAKLECARIRSIYEKNGKRAPKRDTVFKAKL